MATRSAIEIAVGLLARREHSLLEISRKLAQRGFEQDEIERTLEKLQAKNLLSEERFTESYITMRRHRGYGPLRIEQELRERGVDSSIIDIWLDKNDRQWRSLMSQQYRKKYGDEPARDYAEKAKRARYLQSRGFPADWVFKADSFDDIES